MDAKDNLVTHLRDIKKLLHRGEKDGEDSEDALSNGEESSDAEDDRNLNRRIADLKKLIASQSKRLKGEGSDASEDDGYGIMEESIGNLDDDEHTETQAAEARR